ncbi:MAG TPA: DUF1800 domain-containing protein [Dyella sp.]|uniref:DUF1800 domain-containing protein n=1 Tax=Dyella sp. TaxID=1869338 RepID=UPI002D788807|nr:DUF1800 domain-containing protein [Dyella sp.]HET6552023.1 DUF1800 domain-containing protein [Dyella sp.]
MRVATKPTHGSLRPLLAAATLVLAIGPGAAIARSPQALSQDDVDWLRRDGFDLDSATVARYRDLGRSRYLDQQLDDKGSDALPPQIQALINGFEVASTPTGQLLAGLRDEQEKLKAMPDGDDKTAAKKAQQEHANLLLQQAQQIELLHAIYGPNQLKEQMVWFWLNHFSIYGAKGRVRWVAADYAQESIRPHALGKFRDLVMATLQSPAMMEFLDNAQNAKGHVNENYARELMELHTLGVGSGYTQQDVQQLALILTGSGVAPLRDRPVLDRHPRFAAQFVRNGLFEFNPMRHDYSDKVLLGQKIRGSGFNEVEQAVELITRQPACAQFISRKLAAYFVADDPPPALVAKMAHTFQRTDGDIAEVMRTMLESKELSTSYGKKFKDPMQFVVSSVRVAYDGKPLANAKPLINWLNQLGEPVFGRLTPDGWPLDASGWSSSGQMAKRFEIAGAIGTGNNRLLTPEGLPRNGGDFPMLTTRLYYDTFDPYLSAPTRDALAKATSQQEWNTFLLSSPDFNYR